MSNLDDPAQATGDGLQAVCVAERERARRTSAPASGRREERRFGARGSRVDDALSDYRGEAKLVPPAPGLRQEKR